MQSPETAVRQGHFDRAEGYAKRGVAAAPQDFAMYTLLADIRVRSDHRDKAIEAFNDGIKTCQSKAAKAQILWHLANLYLDSRGGPDGKDDIAAAVDCIEKMRRYDFSPVQIAFLEARVLYANDDWKSAREGFEKVRSKLTDFPDLMKRLDYWIGYCYLQQGNPDHAMAAFRRSLSYDKFYFKAREGVAQIFLADGQFQNAAEEYRVATAGNPIDGDAQRAFAQTLLRWNLSRSPSERDWKPVWAALQRAEKLSPGDGRVKLLFADLLVYSGQESTAGNLIEQLHKAAPKNVEFWIVLANMAARKGHLDQAQQILDEVRSKLGDSVSLRLARAVFLLRGMGLQAGVEIGAQIEDLAGDADAFSSDEKVRLWNGLLNNLLEIKEYDRAKRLCRQIGRLHPHDALIRYRLLELALKTHSPRDPAASLAELDQVLAEIDGIAGQGPLSQYGKAVRLTLEAEQGKPELYKEAMECAEKAKKMRLRWSRPDVLQGEICRRRGNNEEALEHFLQASVNGDRDLEFVRDLLQMLYERQRYHDAEQVIHRLDSNQTAVSTDVAKEEIQFFMTWGKFDRALELANAAYNAASEDYREHVWHGHVLKLLARRAQREGHPDKVPEIARKAEESLRTACRIAPNAADCRVELVQLLVATNQPKKAHFAADDAHEMIRAQDAPLAMGHIYEILGDETAKAGQSYEKALKAMPDQPLAIRVLADFYVRNGNFQRAAPLVERLLSGGVPASENDLVSARRLKAEILLSPNQGYSKLKEAAELIDRNLASSLAQPQDTRLKIRILLADPRQARGAEVLELAEKLVGTGEAEPDPGDRFQLARLHFARGNWDRCREQMKKLVDGNQTIPLYLAAYIGMLLERNQLEEAADALDRLERPGVSSPGQTVDLRVEWLYRKNDWGKVPDFLEAYVNQGAADPGRMLRAARLLEDLGERSTAPGLKDVVRNYFEKARQWYEAYVGKCPGSEMLLAGFEARHGKVEAAIEQIQRYGEKSPPEEVFEVVGAIVSRPATAQQLKTLEAILVALLDKTHRPTPLLVARAEVQSARNRPQAAEEIYREILRKDPNDDMACNNLAMVLALQGTKLNEALALIDKTIQRAGPLGPFLDTRAVVSIARGQPQQALQDLELALAEKATPLRLFHRAWAYQEGGNPDKAKESLQLARNARLEDAMLAEPELEIRKKIAPGNN